MTRCPYALHGEPAIEHVPEKVNQLQLLGSREFIICPSLNDSIPKYCYYGSLLFAYNSNCRWWRALRWCWWWWRALRLSLIHI